MNLYSTRTARRTCTFIASATLVLLSVPALAHDAHATADTVQNPDSKACEVRTVRRIGGHPGKQLTTVRKQRVSKTECTRTSGDAVSGYRR